MLSKKIGLGERLFNPSFPRRQNNIVHLSRPMGMEYFGYEMAALFRGREKEKSDLLNQIIAERFSLLIGNSGVGKTSIINAGLLPVLSNLGWQTAVSRPVAPITTSLKTQIWAQLMEGNCPPDFGLAAVVKACVAAHAGSPIAIVVDQFEDALAPRMLVLLPELINELVQLRAATGANFRMLFAYRSDVEAEAGPVWQAVSGSPGGLARLYVGPLTRDAAVDAFTTGVTSTSRNQRRISAEMHMTIQTIINDLEAESLVNGFMGVFPPFLQMVLSAISTDGTTSDADVAALYTKLGGARGIISDFLLSQLRLFGADEVLARQLLISLVSSYGTKTQKTIDALAIETSISPRECARVLSRLRSARLVRITEGRFEIIHDFLARRIITEVVSADEKDAKRCQELLISRSSTYRLTNSLLSYAEHLYIYRYRERISCSEEEVKFLYLSASKNRAPVAYWTSRIDRQKLAAWDRETHFLGQFAAGNYRSLKMADPRLIETKSNDDISSLLRSLSHPTSYEVRVIAARRLVQLAVDLNAKWVHSLGRARNLQRVFVFAEVCRKMSSTKTPDWCRWAVLKGSALERLFGAIALGCQGEATDLDTLQRLLHLGRNSSSRVKFCLGFAIATLAERFRKRDILQDLIRSRENDVAAGAISAIRRKDPIVYVAVSRLIDRAKEHVIPALVRLCSKQVVQVLRTEMLERRSELFVCAELIRMLLKYGDGSDFLALLDMARHSDIKIDVRYSASLFQEAARHVTGESRLILKCTVLKKQFWDPLLDPVGDSADDGDNVPLASNFENTYLVRWLCALPLLYTATRDDRDLVIRLMSHSYWNIQYLAGRTMLRISERQDLSEFITLALAEREIELDKPGPFSDLLQAADYRFYQKNGEPVAGSITYRTRTEIQHEKTLLDSLF